jgi:ABC-type multidrug transport system fused ATPase/permease subunit
LHNISFKVKHGNLVIVVGENGSGKSTLLKLLTGIYAPTSGKILIDARAKDQYSMSDLRGASAHFDQDHRLFPLSMADIIGLGLPSSASDMARVRQAAKDGGSLSFIEQLPQGFQTILHPVKTSTMAVSSRNNDDTSLVQEYNKIERSSEISGTLYIFLLLYG